jgi:hypothetical protein
VASSIALVVIVTVGQAHDPATLALVDATHGTANAKVVVEEVNAPADEEALAIAARDHADVVAVVIWDPDHMRATVHLHRAGDSRWLDRAVGFQAADAPNERGRTVGFAIASMLPDTSVEDRTPPPPLPPVVVPPPPNDVIHPPELPRKWHGAIDAMGEGAFAVGGYGGGVGAQLAGHWYFLPHLALRLGFAIRSGQIPPAQATSLTLTGGLGLGVRWLEPSKRQPFEMGARASLLLIRQSMSHLSADDANAAVQSRWLPGAELMLEGGFYFVPNAAVILATGTEVTMGETQVYVARRPVATLAPWHLAGEIGLRARF